MDKLYIKSQIAMRQSEFPTHLIKRDNPLPIGVNKIITIPGVRRCGKSSRMEVVVNELLSMNVDRARILWVSFDDERLVRMKSDELYRIIEAYREMYPDVDMASVYMFFDEIQLIEGWEYFVMRLYKHYSKNIYISGSNATMLSSELKSALRGWPLEEETYPLSFREYCEFTGVNVNGWSESDLAKIRNAFFAYNNEGGFPEVVLTNNPLLKFKILQGYFDTMLLKDLVEHYGLSNIEVLRYFLKRIMANLTKPTSIRAIHGDIKSRGLKVSKDILYDWAKYACDIFMFLRIPNYSKSLQKVESSQPKYYCIDNGLRDSVLLPQSNDDGKKLENTVFLQLYRQRTPVDSIYYYQGAGECDFVVQRGNNIEQLIQVTWDMSDAATRKREISGLLEASVATNCENLLIITADHREEIAEVNGKTIQVIPAWQWLLNK
ncbi:MAG: ATP-binding protein [Firmicutes bacterium]|nr:ATP-binding protein [Bacillota bacterium]MCM1400791.1 ATP-binding protein [Bacteroides sp.]MCM1476708.1 ATP-binding protein [Bacteroides sp.]